MFRVWVNIKAVIEFISSSSLSVLSTIHLIRVYSFCWLPPLTSHTAATFPSWFYGSNPPILTHPALWWSWWVWNIQKWPGIYWLGLCLACQTFKHLLSMWNWQFNCFALEHNTLFSFSRGKICCTACPPPPVSPVKQMNLTFDVSSPNSLSLVTECDMAYAQSFKPWLLLSTSKQTYLITRFPSLSKLDQMISFTKFSIPFRLPWSTIMPIHSTLSSFNSLTNVNRDESASRFSLREIVRRLVQLLAVDEQ